MSALTKKLSGYYNSFSGAFHSVAEAANDFVRDAKNNPKQIFVENPVQVLHDFGNAVDNFTTEAYFFPKQTLVEKPIAGVKAAHAFASETADKALPAFVPRDKTTRNLIAFSAAAYIADSWDPFPIGETIAAITLSAATARGAVIGWRQTHQTNAPTAQHAVLANDDLH